MKAVSTPSRIRLANILFASDFSSAAAAAIPYAKELAVRYGAKLYALHVRPIQVNPFTPTASWRDLERAAEAEAKVQAETLVHEFSGIQPEVMIEQGDVWSCLASAVESKQIDLIVIGTRGRSGITKFVLGSTAEEIFRQATCPVLTVGPHSKPPEHGARFRQIVYATDFGDESLAAAPYAKSLAQEFQTQLTLMHVIPDPKPGELVTAMQTRDWYERLLQELTPLGSEPPCECECVVEVGEAADKILQVSKDKEADLIVLGVRPESGFPGAATHLPIATAHKVVSHATCPVLTVRG